MTRGYFPRDRLYEYHEVRWGLTRCAGRYLCERNADLLYDGRPLCIDCADLLLERQEVIARHPEVRNLLPPLWEQM